MAKSLIETLQETSDAATDFRIRLQYGHGGIARIWEQKMHPGYFDLLGDMRRDARKEKRHMNWGLLIALLSCFLFWAGIGVLIWWLS